jgi:ankyrin repeat protein
MYRYHIILFACMTTSHLHSLEVPSLQYLSAQAVLPHEMHTHKHFACYICGAQRFKPTRSATNTRMYEKAHKGLLYCILEKQYRLADDLIAVLPDVNFADDQGYTPLHYASCAEAVPVVQRLLSKNASPHATGKSNNTPLHLAAKKGNLTIIDMLLNAGASIDERNKHLETPLFLAVKYNHAPLVKYLLDSHASVHAKNKWKETPVHCACRNGVVEIVRLLCAHGGDLTAQDVWQKTPLHTACDAGALPLVSYLLTQPVCLMALDNESQTPADCAMNHHYTVIANLLANHGGLCNNFWNKLQLLALRLLQIA